MRSLAAVIAATIVAMALVRWLVVVQGVQEPLSRGPDRVVEGFVADLSERPQEALKALCPPLRLKTSALDLARLDQILRRRYRSYTIEPGGPLVHVPQGLQYVATVKTADGRLLPSHFRLHRDPLTGLWQITSFEGLRKLTTRQPPPYPDGLPVSL